MAAAQGSSPGLPCTDKKWRTFLGTSRLLSLAAQVKTVLLSSVCMFMSRDVAQLTLFFQGLMKRTASTRVKHVRAPALQQRCWPSRSCKAPSHPFPTPSSPLARVLPCFERGGAKACCNLSEGLGPTKCRGWLALSTGRCPESPPAMPSPWHNLPEEHELALSRR